MPSPLPSAIGARVVYGARVSLSGLIGVSLLGTGLLATFVLAVLRNWLLPWCPGCDGRGALALTHRLARSCDVCQGSGLLRVPDTAPADWFPQA